MAPDELQKAWQSQTVQTHVSIDTDLLLKEVQNSQRNFRAMIFWRNFAEVGISLLLLPVWLYLGISNALPWTWYLTVPVLVWVVVFMLKDRVRHPPQSGEPGDALRHCVEESLNQVEHQIWLLRNIFWWYLLPFSVSIMAFFAHVAWTSSDVWWEFVAAILFSGVFLMVLYGSIYFMNQRAVRQQLEPQRTELLMLLRSLSDETNGDAAGEIDIQVSISAFAENGFIRGAGGCMTPRRSPFSLVAGVCGIVICLMLAGGILYFARELAEADRSQVNDTQPENRRSVGVRAADRRRLASTFDGPPRTSGPKGEALARLVVDQRKKKGLVALAAMVMVDGKVQAAAAHGERKLRSGVSVEITDRWHLGGATNSVTATMIGRLVEAGQMRWSDTVGEVFSEAPIHDDWKPVTVKQLVTHTAGAPRYFSVKVRMKRPPRGSASSQARQKAILEVMESAPEFTPGKKFGYSLVGLSIAGAMAEQVTNDTWEDLVRQLVFEPLELKDAGFGPPKSSRISPEQPRGHRMLPGKTGMKYAANDKADNTPIMGPGGTVHMTLHDLCTYATEHLRGYFREGKILSAETHKVLHTPDLNQYACGWMRRKPDAEIPVTVYWHNGSNTLWYAMVAFIPEKNMVVAVTSNDGDSRKGEAAAWEIVKSQTMLAEAIGQPDTLKTSPFSGVRWQGFQPEVKLGGEWFQLVSLNDLSATEIVSFSRKNFDDSWRKRFEEDLVRLLAQMGHPPKDTVTLVVQSLATGKKSVRSNVAMTEANRQAIRDANREVNK